MCYRRRKEEAEEKRTKAKKARMGFMKMLAQNTQIDGRSRWDDAERTLRDDSRFKAVSDASDREDLFNEFVEALTKKEKVTNIDDVYRNRCCCGVVVDDSCIVLCCIGWIGLGKVTIANECCCCQWLLLMGKIV